MRAAVADPCTRAVPPLVLCRTLHASVTTLAKSRSAKAQNSIWELCLPAAEMPSQTHPVLQLGTGGCCQHSCQYRESLRTAFVTD
jgi:hypothetical protein